MSNLKSIRQRIVSTKETVKVTRVVQLVAVAKFRQARDFALSSYAFYVASKDLMKKIAHLIPSILKNPTFNNQESQLSVVDIFTSKMLNTKKTESKEEFIVLITSNKGLCGNLNSSVVKLAVNYIVAKNAEYPNIKFTICLIGSKAKNLLKTNLPKNINLSLDNFDILYDEKIDNDKLQSGLTNIFEKWKESNANDITLFYNHFTSSMLQEAKHFNLIEDFCKSLSVNLNLQKDENLHDFSTSDDNFSSIEMDKKYILDTSHKHMFDLALKRFIFSTINSKIRSHIASEYALKMQSMDNATRNGEKLIQSLVLQYNKERQDVITKELIDLLGGSNAVIQQ